MPDTPAEKLAAAEARLAEMAPGYLDLVRVEAERLSIPDPEIDDVRAALDAVDEFSEIDLDVPTASRFPPTRMLKAAIKRLIAWYLNYVGRQITTLGEAMANLGAILVDDSDVLRRDTRELQTQVAALTERVSRLETGQAGPHRI